MTPFPFRFVLILILTCHLASVKAQPRAVLDTLQTKNNVLAQLIQSESFEQAQVEAESYKAFLKRNNLLITPQAVRLISKIYKTNNDDRSATRFLAESELDARKTPEPEKKAALLKVLVEEFRRWELPEQALIAQQMLSIAQDSANMRARRVESESKERRLDSLIALREQELSIQAQYVRIERKNAYLIGGAAGLVFLLMLFSNFRNNDSWRKLLDKKELEWDLMRTNIQHEAEEKSLADHVLAVETAQQQSTEIVPTRQDPYMMYHGSKPEQIALLIEPNRQVVLYLKSLLSDRFQIETASTPTEGMQMVSNLLPDLVVCDAILNGKTGIDVARQIKLSERTNHIPVVLLTDRFGNEGKMDSLRAGADAWFTRPVIDDEFDATVQRLLDVRKVKHEQFSRFLQLYFTDNRMQLHDPFLIQTILMVDQNLANPDFTADDIARKLQMTKPHYVKKLRVLTGKEPVQLIRELRLEKAKTLLEKRAATPQVISELVGFSSPGTFSLAFKEYFGENTLLLYAGGGLPAKYL